MESGTPCNASVVEREELSAELCVLRVRPDAGVPDFEPGQHTRLGLPLGTAGLVRRSYSIASSSGERRWLELLLVRVPGGELSEALAALAAGSRLWVDETARGHFTLAAIPRDAHLLLVATGTGLAPFASMLRTYACPTDPSRARWERLVLVHGARTAPDLAYREELERLARADPSVAYFPIVSREPEASAWRGLRGRVQRVLLGPEPPALLDGPIEPERTHAFLCGNPDMVRSVGADFLARGFRRAAPGQPGNLHTERYW